MDYKYIIIEGVSVVIVEQPEFFRPANGRIFKQVLKEKFSDEVNEFIFALLDADGNFIFENTHSTIDDEFLRSLPEDQWTTATWGD